MTPVPPPVVARMVSPQQANDDDPSPLEAEHGNAHPYLQYHDVV